MFSEAELIYLDLSGVEEPKSTGLRPIVGHCQNLLSVQQPSHVEHAVPVLPVQYSVSWAGGTCQAGDAKCEAGGGCHMSLYSK